MTTRLEIQNDAEAEVAVGLLAGAGAGGGLALELRGVGDLSSAAFVVEASTSTAISAAVAGGLGGGFDFGPVEPRAGARFKIGGELKQSEKAAIRLTDISNPQQARALAAFLLIASPPLIPSGPGGSLAMADALLDQALEGFFDLEAAYRPFLVTSESGVTWTGTASGFLGALTAQRPGLDPFSYGIGGEGAASVGVGVEFDELTGAVHVVFRGTARVGGVLDSTSLDGVFGGLTAVEEFLADITDVAANAALSVSAKFSFQDTISVGSLTKITFELQPQTTLNQAIETTTISVVFEGENLRDVFLQNAPDFFLQVATNPFGIVRMATILTTAVLQLEASVTVTELRGDGVSSAFGFGVQVDVGGRIDVGAQLGATVRLTSAMKTKQWLIQQATFVRVSDFPFADPLADEKRFIAAVDSALQYVFDSLGAQITTVLTSAGSAAQVIVGRLTEATLGVAESGATFTDAFGNVLGSTVDATVNVVGTTLNTFLGLDPSAFRPAQAGSIAFAVSEFFEITPAGITVDPPLPLTISYPAAFDGDPQRLRIFQRNADGSWASLASSVDLDAGTVSTAISAFGVFVVGLDTTPPVITLLSEADELQALLSDVGSGIDGGTAVLLIDGVPASTTFDPVSGVLSHTAPIAASAFAEVVVSDGADNESRAVVSGVVPERVAILLEGWNLIGWTGAAAGVEAIDPLVSQISSLFTWDAARQNWDTFSPVAPSSLNSVDGFAAGAGVWLHVTDPAGIEWIQPDSSQPSDPIALSLGFNLVVWRGPDGTLVTDAVAPLGAALTGLFVNDTPTQSFRSYSPNLPAALNTAVRLQHGDGVWINVSAPALFDENID